MIQSSYGNGKFWVGAVMLGVLLACPVASARAETVSNAVDRARQAYAADGIRGGFLMFYPTITFDQMYDDNIFKSKDNPKEDWITVLRGSLGVETDFDLHQLYLRGSVTDVLYKDTDSEEYTSYNVSGGGRFDLDYDTYLAASTSHRRAFEDRSSEDDVNADSPTQFSLNTSRLNFVRALSIIKLYVDVMHDQFRFENSRRGPVVVDNTGRDRDIYTLKTRLAYEFSPGYDLYVEGRNDWRRYDQKAAQERDSQGYDLRVGTDVYITGKMKGDLYAGHLRRDFDGDFRDVSATSYGGSILFNITPITSITGTISRDVEETTFSDTSGNLKTRYGLQLDHAIREFFFLRLDGGYTTSNFQSRSSAERTDKTYEFGSALEYIPPYEGLSLKLRYDYIERQSTTNAEDYENNRIMLTIGKQF